MKSESKKNLSLIIMAIAFIAFLYATTKAMGIVSKTHVGTSNGIYRSYVTTSKEIQQKAFALTQHCSDELCEVQTLLDFTTSIPYQTNTFQQYSAQRTIQQNFGDCDDKSNLLISMLYALGKEAYFVLVPKHIFIIIALKDERLDTKKGLWVNGKKYYILESTAKGSKVGFPMQFKLEEIDVIVEPFTNQKLTLFEHLRIDKEIKLCFFRFEFFPMFARDMERDDTQRRHVIYIFLYHEVSQFRYLWIMSDDKYVIIFVLDLFDDLDDLYGFCHIEFFYILYLSLILYLLCQTFSCELGPFCRTAEYEIRHDHFLFECLSHSRDSFLASFIETSVEVTLTLIAPV